MLLYHVEEAGSTFAIPTFDPPLLKAFQNLNKLSNVRVECRLIKYLDPILWIVSPKSGTSLITTALRRSLTLAIH